MSDNSHVIGGLKATAHNTHYSEETRQRAVEKLQDMGVNENKTSAAGSGIDSHESHVIGGYKATIKNPNASDAAKARAQEMIAASEANHAAAETQHENHILGGYKAALHNPNTSAEAKQHAEAYLKEHNAL